MPEPTTAPLTMPPLTIDLRSDTVTRPTPAMRRAMAEAEVGDDVYGEDPTVRRLEEEAAAAMGHEAALFVPSGTMGNEIALGVAAPRGTEVITEARSHIIRYEVGAMAALNGLLPRPIQAARGLLDPQEVEEAIQPSGGYGNTTGAIEVEDTHNIAGGTVYPPEQLDALVAVARRHGLPIHLDGARIWNAAVAAGVPASRLARGFDSVMFCLSKGLGAPVGSMLCASADFIRRARRMRKMLGGGMRQAGVLAAAGLLALREGPGRLAEDHDNARYLATRLAEIPGLDLDPEAFPTNILILGLTPDFPGDGPAPRPADSFLARLKEKGVLGVPVSRTQVRLVTHRDVDRSAIDRALNAIRELAGVG